MIFFVCSILSIFLFSQIESSNNLCLEKNVSVEVNFSSESDEKFSILDNFFDKPFFIEKIEYKPDIKINSYELQYLTDLVQNSWITLDDLKRACWYLKKKNKFESAIISFDNYQKKLTIFLKSQWNFGKVKFQGSLSGKDRYKLFYLFEPGEIFDLNKHQKSIEKISVELKNEGHLAVKIDDYLSYDNSTKQVNVILKFNQVEQFKINQLNVEIKMQKSNNSTNVNKLKKKLEKNLISMSTTGYYSISQIEKYIENIKRNLVNKGYLHPIIRCNTQILNKSSKVNINFEVTVSQKERFLFEGNTFFTSEELLNKLLVIDNSILIIPPSLLIEELIELYKNNGFWNISVQYKKEDDKNYFLINEGLRAKISKITLSEKDEILEEHVQKIFSPLVQANFFDAQILNKCIDELTSKNVQEGFWDFSVLNQDYVLIAIPESYNLILKVNKGSRRMLSNVTIEGYPALANNKFFIKWKNLQKSMPFDISIVQEQKQWLLKYFKSQGYFNVNIKPELIEKNNETELRWKISGTDVVRFGKTIVTGCNRISDKIILREIVYKEGQVYEKEKLDETVKRLKTLNMFESVSAVPSDLLQSKDTKTILLSVVEDDPLEVKVRFGVAQISKTFTNLPSATYKIGGSFLWKNPLKMADILRFDADLSRFSRNFAVSYEMPWILNQPIATLIRAYSYQVGQPLMGGSNKKIYNENHEGFSFSFNRQLYSFKCNLTTGFDFLKVSNLSCDLAKLIQYEPFLLDRRIPYFFIEPSILFNNLDNLLDPTCGGYTLLSARGYLPINIHNAHFVKLNFEQAFIRPIYNNIIGAIRLRAGHIFNANFESIIPTERFYLGGPNTIRAYEPNMVPPINSFKCDNERFWVPVGGKSMFNLNAEIRFPIYKQLSGVMFNDAGFLVANGFSQISAKDIFGATGFGLRYATPLGPVRFDIGFKWKKRAPDDKAYAFYLTLGQAF